MKKWLKNNWNTLVLGYSIGLTSKLVFDFIDSIVVKIAILMIQK